MDRQKFFDAARLQPFGGHLAQSQVDGMSAILDAWDRYAPGADIRHVAYSLATTFHETARTMQPIEEIGHGRGRSYGVPAGKWHQIYDGRGDVQLTWQKNYAHATIELRKHGCIAADIDLERAPDLAMSPAIAAPIMIFGMLEGWFTGKKLADYFSGDHSDPVNARRIINGLDRANDIAAHHARFLAALRAAS